MPSRVSQSMKVYTILSIPTINRPQPAQAVRGRTGRRTADRGAACRGLVALLPSRWPPADALDLRRTCQLACIARGEPPVEGRYA
eukprot:18814-Eustigmatos_ZCMA.PRE.1